MVQIIILKNTNMIAHGNLIFSHVGNSMPNQHKKMTSVSDFHETWYICLLPQVIVSYAI